MPNTFRYTAGLNNVGNYQASARPFVRSNIAVPHSQSQQDAPVFDELYIGSAATAYEVIFPKVTKFVTIRNDGTDQSASAELRVAFSSGGLGDHINNYFVIPASSSFSADFRVTKLYLMSNGGTTLGLTASVIAGLTQIEATHLTSSWEYLNGVG
jgi:hypothetical protein